MLPHGRRPPHVASGDYFLATALAVRGAAALRGCGDAADLRQDREPLLPRPSELGREPQQRPQPPQDLLIQVRVQILGGGRLDQDGTVEIDDPARRIKVVDRAPDQSRCPGTLRSAASTGVAMTLFS